ncbi:MULTISPECIES: adenylyl-sulfate kinase [Pseudomonas]|uniref:Adenylyl-sulfate kinase n=1 Tax=Pseudomonas asplenii TaxID=53407 RepID=A0A0N0E581_9PSED|nr:adenylyl-sulfate kinase [Pseudomonas fuscovaginae]KPA92121.1 adenylylsulfate kinase [Pseudomonas fuscovaginae]KPA95971.1 adenylylsulfate kinase [Pseudomonas fuscovaginae]
MSNVKASGNLHPWPEAALAGSHLPLCVWFTGLSGSGKTTLARGIEQRLLQSGARARVLDGDDLRVGLNRDLGFSAGDRKENVRRLGEVARLFHDSGFIVLVSAISPFAEDRQAARALFAAGRFIEVHVATPLQVCESRDPKGLYQRARRGDLPGFTGIDSAYEPPRDCECVVQSERCTVDEGVLQVLAIIERCCSPAPVGERKGA